MNAYLRIGLYCTTFFINILILKNNCKSTSTAVGISFPLEGMQSQKAISQLRDVKEQIRSHDCNICLLLQSDTYV